MKKQFDYFPFMLLLPAMLLIMTMVAWPLFETFRLSLTNASLNPVTEYVGFKNYTKVLGDDFFEIVTRTFLWMGTSVALKMLIGIFGAVLLNAAIPGRTLARILVMPPWIIPVAIGMFMWGWLYNGQFGMISGVMQKLGFIDGPFEFLGYKTAAFFSTIVADVWVGVPMVTLYLLASMQTISGEFYEAAWVDGASRWYRFKRITLPMILPSVATMALLSSILTFNSFDIIWILTEGGPRDATNTMIIDTYKTAISRTRYGEGAARAVMILVCLSLFAGVFLTITKKFSAKGAKS